MTAENKTENQTGNQRWLENHFETRSPIGSSSEFMAQTIDRRKELGGLPTDVLKMRQRIRASVGLTEEDVFVIYGEQPCGLNEPPLILGKRLLAKHLEGRGVRVLDYRASSDVVGSEGGIHKLELPFPYNPEGLISIKTLKTKNLSQVPARRVSTSFVELKTVIAALDQAYRNYPSVEREIEALKNELSIDQPYSQAQNNLLANLEERLGLTPQVRVEDVEFDTQAAQLGALEFLLDHWTEISRLAQKYSNSTTRVPSEREAPFYAYFDDIEMRLGIWFDRGSKTNYVAAHPYRADEVIREFNIEDILEGNVGITFRAIPRIILFSLIFDGHITGGGALYNQVAQPVFEEIFKISYFPLIWMDLAGKNGACESVLSYDSVALKRGWKEPGHEKARALVEQGLVAMFDLAVSIGDFDVARKAVEEVIGKPNLLTSQRVDLRK